MRTPMLIGVAGRISSGKDTVGGMIKRQVERKGHGVKLMAFAKPIKEITRQVYDFTDEQMSDPVLKNQGDPRYPRLDGTLLSPREAMQKLGTEWGRACYPDTWAALGMRLAGSLTKAGLSVVLTDVRFVNEARLVRGAGGAVWRIRRPSADSVQATHASELEMDTPQFNELTTNFIRNEGTLEALTDRVRELLL